MVYKEFSKDEKLSLVALLNWDYTDSAEDLLSVVNGKSKNSASFSEESLFARSLESLKWGDLVNLWTLERCVSLYTPTVRRMIRSHFLREEYDRIFSILQGKPLSYSRQSSDHLKKLQQSILFNRRNSIKPWLLQS